MEANLTIGISFAAGILSFLSPCVLPLIPAYLSLMGGTSLQEMTDNRSVRRNAVFNTVFFIVGFSIVFIALGILFTSTFVLLGGISSTINIVAGIIVIVLGLNFIFDFWKMLNFEKRFHIEGKPTSAPASLLFGMAFGAGWSPCIGPILSSILFLAGSEGSLSRGLILLVVYSAGLGLPFLLTGIFLPLALKQLERIKRHLPRIRIASGVFLVLIGLLIALGRLQQFNVVLFSLAYRLEEWEAANPSSARAWISGGFFALAAIVGGFAVRKYRRNRRAGNNAFLPVRMALFVLLVTGGVLSLAGVINVADALAFWFSYQGI